MSFSQNFSNTNCLSHLSMIIRIFSLFLRSEGRVFVKEGLLRIDSMLMLSIILWEKLILQSIGANSFPTGFTFRIKSTRVLRRYLSLVLRWLKYVEAKNFVKNFLDLLEIRVSTLCGWEVKISWEKLLSWVTEGPL